MDDRGCSGHTRWDLNAKVGPAKPSSWGKKWGKKPHRFQPISADLDLAETA